MGKREKTRPKRQNARWLDRLLLCYKPTDRRDRLTNQRTLRAFGSYALALERQWQSDSRTSYDPRCVMFCCMCIVLEIRMHEQTKKSSHGYARKPSKKHWQKVRIFFAGRCTQVQLFLHFSIASPFLFLHPLLLSPLPPPPHHRRRRRPPPSPIPALIPKTQKFTLPKKKKRVASRWILESRR